MIHLIWLLTTVLVFVVSMLGTTSLAASFIIPKIITNIDNTRSPIIPEQYTSDFIKFTLVLLATIAISIYISYIYYIGFNLTFIQN